MKKLLIFLLSLAVLTPSSLYAKTSNTLNWSLETDEDSTISLCTHRNFSEEWKGWINESISILNDQTGVTGLNFEIVPFSTDRCQIFLISRDIDEYQYAGSTVVPFDTVKQTDNAFDGEVNAAVVTLDSYLEKTIEWIANEEDVDDQFHDGWSTNKREGTLDPVDVTIHAIGRALGTLTNDSYKIDQSSQNLFDPRKNGEHIHVLSEQDVEDFIAIRTHVDARTVHTLDVNGETIEDGAISLDIPRYAFGFAYRDYEVTVLDDMQLPPISMEVPSDFAPVFYAFGVYTEENLRLDVPVEVAYEDDDLQAGDVPVWDANGVYAPALDESSIQVVRFEKDTWDLTPLHITNNPSAWRIVSGSEVDGEENLVSFSIDEPGIYGLIAKVDESVETVALDEFYQVVNGSVLTGAQLEKRMFIKNIIGSILRQLPTFIIGFICGGLIVFLFFADKTRKKRNSDSIPDIHRLEEAIMGNND